MKEKDEKESSFVNFRAFSFDAYPNPFHFLCKSYPPQFKRFARDSLFNHLVQFHCLLDLEQFLFDVLLNIVRGYLVYWQQFFDAIIRLRWRVSMLLT